MTNVRITFGLSAGLFGDQLTGGGWGLNLIKQLIDRQCVAGYLAAILIFISASASASEWLFVTAATDGTMLFIDSSSIKRSGNHYIKAWTGTANTDGTNSKILNEFNCEAEASATMSSVSYDVNGAVSDSTTVDVPKFSPIVPDSIFEPVLSIVCAKSPKAALLIHAYVPWLSIEDYAKDITNNRLAAESLSKMFKFDLASARSIGSPFGSIISQLIGRAVASINVGNDISWKQFSDSIDFNILPDRYKQEARNRYFTRIVLPKLNEKSPEEILEARKQFDSFTDGTDNKEQEK